VSPESCCQQSLPRPSRLQAVWQCLTATTATVVPREPGADNNEPFSVSAAYCHWCHVAATAAPITAICMDSIGVAVVAVTVVRGGR
jgi:hypothetical protein